MIFAEKKKECIVDLHQFLFWKRKEFHIYRDDVRLKCLNELDLWNTVAFHLQNAVQSAESSRRQKIDETDELLIFFLFFKFFK